MQQSDAKSAVPNKLRGLNAYVETYGCQMNVSDSEVVQAILQEVSPFTVVSALYCADRRVGIVY